MELVGRCCWALLWVIFFQTFSMQAVADSLNPSLQGPAFSEPKESKWLVSPGWQEKSITYPSHLGSPDLFVSLDQHFYPAAKILIEAYGKKHGLSIVVVEGTCGTSTGLIASKGADIAGFCCPPALSDRLPGLVFHTVGIIPNVLIAHPTNPVDNLSLQEAQHLFSGEIPYWNGLADPKAQSVKGPVKPITRMHCKIRPGHWRLLIDNEDLHSPMIHNVSSIPDMMDTVAADPKAVGFLARWLLTPKQLERLKILTLDNLHPDQSGVVVDGRYPLYNVVNITTWSGASQKEEAQKLVRYLLSHQESYDPAMFIIPADHLRKAGWRFVGDELIGEPDS
ncbi:MAG: hypothetical protein HQL72_11345 [Magnetococcales bacterium]|nr:hypothetical protein [Magnetococcales bacterium]